MLTPIDKIAQTLSTLLNDGAISASRIKSKKLKELFDQLVLSQIIKLQRKGAGNEYFVLNKAALETHIAQTYPNGLYQNTTQENRRIQGIAEKGNTKEHAGLGFELVTLSGDTGLKINDAKYDLNDYHLPAYLSLKITDSCKLSLSEKTTIWTIENPTAFIHASAIKRTGKNLTVYTAGKMSNLLVGKLTQLATDGHELMHFGDFDYVGLLEFCRILEVNDNAQLHVPDVLNKDFFDKYGKTTLLESQVDQHNQLLKKMNTLKHSTGYKQLKNIYNLIQATSKGLEQEAFFITRST